MNAVAWFNRQSFNGRIAVVDDAVSEADAMRTGDREQLQAPPVPHSGFSVFHVPGSQWADLTCRLCEKEFTVEMGEDGPEFPRNHRCEVEG